MKKPGHHPPSWADRLLAFLCRADEADEILGDLHEAFHWRVHEYGLRRARWLFILEVLKSIRFSTLRPVTAMNQYFMIYRNYLKTGWRFLLRHKLYSGMNIFGLALGITFCWLAYLYADDERSYDRHLSDHDRLYRITIDYTQGDETRYIGGSSNAMSVQFLEQIPEIENLVRIKSDYGLLKSGEEVISQSFIIADPEVTALLDLKFVEGTGDNLDLPNEAIISERLAGKLDLRGRAIGSVLSLNRGSSFEDYIIRGVYKNIPENTSIKGDMIVSFTNYLGTAPDHRLTQWFDINMNSLIRLADHAEPGSVEDKMNQLHAENDAESKEKVLLKLQPLTDVHLNPQYGHHNGIAPGGNPDLIRLFIVIGIFCLTISMINYSNFNISLYINRAREVALRKVIGAERSGIFSQLLTESFLSSLLAGFLALVILIGLLPYFSAFVQKSYDPAFITDPGFLSGALSILILVALISGFYPAYILSRFSIVRSLKGEQKIRSGKWITQMLLAVQFVIATVLIAGMLTMHQQVQYMSTFDTKMNFENVLCVEFPSDDDDRVLRFLADLEQLPEIAGVSAISGYNGTRITTEEVQFSVRHLRIERDFAGLLGIQLLDGRNFDPEMTSDQTTSVLVNQTFVDRMGLEKPVGEVIPFIYKDLKNPKIIGVIEDYHFKSAKSEVEPLVIYTSPQYPLYEAYLKLETGAVARDKLEAVWNRHFDPFPFEYTFLQEQYLKAYEAERLMMQMVGFGCFAAIFLAAMGLLGIVGLQLSQSLKEISIRKILGATAANLYQIFTERFLAVIGAGISIGIVLSYYFIDSWLSSYPYRINFGWRVVATTIVVIFTIAFITILCQVFKVVRANPVSYLKKGE